MTDLHQAIKNVHIAIYNLAIALEKTLEIASKDGNIVTTYLLHKIYWVRSLKYRIQYTIALYQSKIVRWLRMTRYA